MPSTPRRRRSNKSASPSPSPRHQSSAQLNPPTDPHEFGGVFGTAATTVFLPLVVIFLAAACQRSPALDVVFFNDGPVEAWKLLVARVGGFGGSGASYRWAFAVCLGWLVAQAALERFLPAEVVPGVKLRDGTQLRYRMNGHLAFWVSVVLALHGWPHILKLGGRLLFDDGQKNVGAEAGALVTSNQLMLHFTAAPLQLVHDHFLELAVASIVVALGLSCYLYGTSFLSAPSGAPARLLAANSGYFCYDFFMGRELNPRLPSLLPWRRDTDAGGLSEAFDLKVFCELRPGLIGWVLINLGMLFKQSSLGPISPEMLSVNFFQALYVWDALYHERAILTTMDVTTDGFGFMLAFGDLVWVPFTYSLQARYLVHNSPALAPWQLVAVWLLNMLGYALFRGSNSEKDQFRRDPASMPHLQSMPTQRGTRLLTSGYWGLARKINYTGDWLMGLSWCLMCGAGSMMPYFYAIYFAILLVHRAWRDDHDCSHKYGADWAKYKEQVPYVFVPGLV